MDDISSIKDMEEWLFTSQAGDKMILIICLILFLSFLVVVTAKRFKFPIVVGYVFLGIIFSVNTIELLPFLSNGVKEWYSFSVENMGFISQTALAFIAFTIGSELSIRAIRRMGKSILYMVFLQAFAAFILVTAGVLLLGQPLYIALLFGTVATATAPAATVMVIKEYNAQGPVTSMIMAIVGIDDAIALFMFSLISPIAYILCFGEGSISLMSSFLLPLLEISASVVVGVIMGYISQRILTNINDKTKRILLVMSAIIGGTGVSLLFNLSPLITNMVIGFVFRNFTVKNLNIGEDLETITIPLYALFFVLAGMEIRFSSLMDWGFILLAMLYTTMRVIGKIGGSVAGAVISKSSSNIKKYVGLGLLPQSGVAIAMAYSIQQQFSAVPKIGLLIFNVILFTSALTEVFGPLATKYALTKAGEVRNIDR